MSNLMYKLLFSYDNVGWETPSDLFEKINSVFNFDTDIYANFDTTKCEKYFAQSDDALLEDWVGTCWMNLPYGREVSKWVSKAYYESKKHSSTIVCLLPARVDTNWWHNFCADAEYIFIKGRLKFTDSPNSAPSPSAIVVFRPTLKDVQL